MGLAEALNEYAYANGSPINGNDPLGLHDYGEGESAVWLLQAYESATQGRISDRYRVHGISAHRSRSDDAAVEIGVWSAGWAGDARHISICYEPVPPNNVVESLDDFLQRNGTVRGGVFRHIEGHWYIWSDG